MAKTITAKKQGRPTVDSEAVNVRMQRLELLLLDDWRRGQSDLPTRPEAVRRLVKHGLGTQRGAPPKAR